jgi:hypothetical protein
LLPDDDDDVPPTVTTPTGTSRKMATMSLPMGTKPMGTILFPMAMKTEIPKIWKKMWSGWTPKKKPKRRACTT